MLHGIPTLSDRIKYHYRAYQDMVSKLFLILTCTPVRCSGSEAGVECKRIYINQILIWMSLIFIKKKSWTTGHYLEMLDKDLLGTFEVVHKMPGIDISGAGETRKYMQCWG